MIDEALEWEQQSGVIFEGDKTVLIYFIRNRLKIDNILIRIKDELMTFKQKVKILEVVFNLELRFCVYILEAGRRGVATALVLQKMQALSPSSAR